MQQMQPQMQTMMEDIKKSEMGSSEAEAVHSGKQSSHGNVASLRT